MQYVKRLSTDISAFSFPIMSASPGNLGQVCAILCSPDVAVRMTFYASTMNIGQFEVPAGAGLHLVDYERFLCEGIMGKDIHATCSLSAGASYTLHVHYDKRGPMGV